MHGHDFLTSFFYLNENGRNNNCGNDMLKVDMTISFSTSNKIQYA